MQQKSKNVLKKIGIAVVCVCILSYSLYHFFSLFSEEIGTIVAGNTTEDEFLTLDGYIMRDSEYVSSNYSGAVDHIASNGEKVAVSDPLAIVYSEGNSSEMRDIIALLDSRIELLLKSANNKPPISELTSLRQKASNTYNSLMKQIASGNISALGAQKKELLVALNSIAMLTDEDFGIANTVETLVSARESLLAASGASEEIQAPKSGYFYSTIDGYEEVFSGKAANELDADGFIALFDSPVSDESAFSYVGKMSYDARWYFASAVRTASAESFEIGESYLLEFSGGGYYDIEMVLARKELSSDGKQTVLVFATELLPEGFGFERRQTVKVITSSVSGIYVPMSAVHRVDFERVVYTLSGSVVRMKYIDVVYEGEDYFIVRDGEGPDGDKVYLKGNDLLVIHGSNLFDGRILD